MTEMLKADYETQRPKADAFLKEFLHQLAALVQRVDISLGVPIEGRVKQWSSIAEKLGRKELKIAACNEVSDLVGVRVITLFKRDVDVLCKLIEREFKVHAKEDKETSLDMSRFGYLSHHFIVTIPRAWKKTPAFSGLDFRVEIQVRTTAQHIWAAASHLLQYKKEADVPPRVARSIYRVAALLETVDLEFERVLAQRAEYSRSKIAVALGSTLDTDNLRRILDSSLPLQNRIDAEPYSELLGDLASLGILTVGAVESLIKKRLEGALAADRNKVTEQKAEQKPVAWTKERVDRGVYYTHAGLVRKMLRLEYGKKADEVLEARWAELHKQSQTPAQSPK